MVELVCFKCAVIVYDETHQAQSRTPLNTSLISVVPYSFYIYVYGTNKRSHQALNNGRIGVLQMCSDSVR